jgi:hypothetical protein
MRSRLKLIWELPEEAAENLPEEVVAQLPADSALIF